MSQASELRLWLVQVDRRTGLAKARSGDLPCFSACAQGMGDSLAGPVFLWWSAADPTGRRGVEMLGCCDAGDAGAAAAGRGS